MYASRFSYKLLDETKGKDDNSYVIQESKNSYLFSYPCDSDYECSPYQITFPKGIYKIELWGASGGNARNQNEASLKDDAGGHGAYVSGKIKLNNDTVMYLFIGGKGENQANNDQRMTYGGYNGGGKGGYDSADSGPDEYGESSAGGGGASDLRLNPYQDISGYMSRIMVAAGGGGGISSNGTKIEYKSTDPGHGGKLEGISPLDDVSEGGTQTTGSFGYGEDGLSFSENDYTRGGSIGGAGGGYNGGTSKKCNKEDDEPQFCESSGAGGSSFISGHEGCKAIEFSKDQEIHFTESSIHYSGLSFYDTDMKMYGDTTFPSPTGDGYENGHVGNGYGRIKLITEFNFIPTPKKSIGNIIVFINIFVIIMK